MSRKRSTCAPSPRNFPGPAINSTSPRPEALPGLAKFFYEVYKLAAPCPDPLGNSTASGALKSFVIESYLLSEQRELSEHLTEAYIVERSRTVTLALVQAETKHDLTAFFVVFDGEKEQADRRRLLHPPRLHQLRKLRLLLPAQEIRFGPAPSAASRTGLSSSPSTASMSSRISRTSSKSSARSTSRRTGAHFRRPQGL